MAFRGELIKAWRTSHGMTQDEAAKKISVTQGFWRGMEAGTRQPSIDTLELISKTTGISTDDLLCTSQQKLDIRFF